MVIELDGSDKSFSIKMDGKEIKDVISLTLFADKGLGFELSAIRTDNDKATKLPARVHIRWTGAGLQTIDNKNHLEKQMLKLFKKE